MGKYSTESTNASRRMEFARWDDHLEGAVDPRQLAFFRQAQSDWTVFRLFHPSGWRWWRAFRNTWRSLVGVRPFSFPLHYLQMCTEKLAKAYYAVPPARMGHNAF